MDHAPLSAWPWENLGSYKYVLYGPFLARLIYSMIWEETRNPSWCLHILLLCALRGLVHQLWSSYCNMLFITRNHWILRQGIDFKQIDPEWHWDNFIILQAFMAGMALLSFPFLTNLPLWNTKGIICLGLATFSEHLMMGVIIGIPTVGTWLFGYGSISLIYGYILVFDFLRCMGHSNVEIIPHALFQIFPFLKYFLYTPTYHCLHHTEMNTNFCLFMPLYDSIWKTINNKSWDLHKRTSSGKNERIADFVFLAHLVDVMATSHSPFFFRSLSSLKYSFKLFLLPMWPFLFVLMNFSWVLYKTFVAASYNLRGRLHQTWMVPRYGFQYFLPFAREGINKVIEEAILEADRMGVKNESLNGGGTLYVNKHPNLRVRVVHGNTLTAAVILKEIPQNATQVFLTGATSKLGTAISLYLCRKKIFVLMLTQSSERFESIQREAPIDCQQFLVQVTKYQAAQHCKTWIIGKWCTPREQSWAPPGTHFHQFVVPPILGFRRDCTYGKLAAMRLPEDVEGLGYCEYTMERGVLHACHAGGVVHLLQGWTHHEVGAIDVDQIDVAWTAALSHGFKPV
ncbi:hypothetical protein VitviT2T_014247 [Vitis vinifera]|uniref:Protein ECERIFERUM 3 n=1 Tax=Vitis vinifera TaxID=29760 RepID=A0ABY9CJC1_VITVI|nr:hypothetical protein VitviT2T_014247 [Vitis vinifera]